MIKIADITKYLEKIAPIVYKEDYDNPGLMIGDYNNEISKILISLDITKEVLIEAKSKKCNLIISHHPLIFQPIKKITNSNYIDECIIYAIKNDISIYAIHTNIDNIKKGMSDAIADLIGLSNRSILRKKSNILNVLTTFVPYDHLEKLKESLYSIGAGNIGNYSKCSFSTKGEGTFLPNESSKPFIGDQNKLEKTEEARLEVIFPKHIEKNIIKELKNNHPYEEVNYYIQNLENTYDNIGSGMIGELENEMVGKKFIEYIKAKFKLDFIKHTPLKDKKIKKVAFCGGSGSFLIKDAINARADIFITGDLKYHDFFYSKEGIILCDIGHYESEVVFKSLIYKVLSKKFTNIVFVKCDTITNPIQFS